MSSALHFAWRKAFLLWLLATVSLTVEVCGEEYLSSRLLLKGDVKSFSVPGPVYTNVVQQ